MQLNSTGSGGCRFAGGGRNPPGRPRRGFKIKKWRDPGGYRARWGHAGRRPLARFPEILKNAARAVVWGALCGYGAPRRPAAGRRPEPPGAVERTRKHRRRKHAAERGQIRRETRRERRDESRDKRDDRKEQRCVKREKCKREARKKREKRREDRLWTSRKNCPQPSLGAPK